MYKGDVPWPQPDGSAQMGPNKVWYDELELQDYYHGRSAVNFRFKSRLTGLKYSVSLSEFFSMVMLDEIKNKVISSNFEFYKQGTAYLVMRSSQSVSA